MRFDHRTATLAVHNRHDDAPRIQTMEPRIHLDRQLAPGSEGNTHRQAVVVLIQQPEPGEAVPMIMRPVPGIEAVLQHLARLTAAFDTVNRGHATVRARRQRRPAAWRLARQPHPGQHTVVESRQQRHAGSPRIKL